MKYGPNVYTQFVFFSFFLNFRLSSQTISNQTIFVEKFENSQLEKKEKLQIRQVQNNVPMNVMTNIINATCKQNTNECASYERQKKKNEMKSQTKKKKIKLNADEL